MRSHRQVHGFAVHEERFLCWRTVLPKTWRKTDQADQRSCQVRCHLQDHSPSLPKQRFVCWTVLLPRPRSSSPQQSTTACCRRCCCRQSQGSTAPVASTSSSDHGNQESKKRGRRARIFFCLLLPFWQRPFLVRDSDCLPALLDGDPSCQQMPVHFF